MSALSDYVKKHHDQILDALELPPDDKGVSWSLVFAQPSRIQAFLEEVRQQMAKGQPFQLTNLEPLAFTIEEVIELIDGLKALGAKVNIDYREVSGGWELFWDED